MPEQSPDVIGEHAQRHTPGMNHLALTSPDRAALDEIHENADQHGWRELFSESSPHAGGTDHTAWYGETVEGIEVELVVPRP